VCGIGGGAGKGLAGVNVNWHDIGLKQVVLIAWLWQMPAGFLNAVLSVK
jgi:hypothetical protein